jgi:HEPN domain-containing protein
MNKQEKFDYWLDIAGYDLDTAEAMSASKRWIYVVFMCQQAIEKLIKGLCTLHLSDEIPRVHNIRTLFELIEDKLSEKASKEYYELFDTLSAYYLNNRYPDFVIKLSSQIKEAEAQDILEQTKETYAWLLTMKP